jgi:hypothetical protein
VTLLSSLSGGFAGCFGNVVGCFGGDAIPCGCGVGFATTASDGEAEGAKSAECEEDSHGEFPFKDGEKETLPSVDGSEVVV